MNNTAFRLGELFSGPGGIALGASWASVQNATGAFSIEHAWASDYDADTCETYRNNLCPTNRRSVVHKDVRELRMGDLMKISDIDALAFGFPCNDFSVVGEQKGTDGVFGPLYTHGIRVLKYFQPKWFLAENVGGLRNSNDGNALETILSEMTAQGYTVTPHHYKFENYGVPQARHRIIIVGLRWDLNLEFKVPSPEPFKDLDVTSWTAITQPPIPKDAPNNELTKQSATVAKRLEFIKPGENAFTADLPEHLRLNVKGAKISQIYKRLDPTKPAYTVTGSGGGGTHVYHWSENRALTNRERARLQTFPDNFIFAGSKESVRKQIGMAVPPKGAKVIFEAILKTFAGVDYESIVPNIKLPTPLLQQILASMIVTNLFDEVLVRPVKNGADQLVVVSGYATAAMAFHHLDKIKNLGLSVKVDLIIGMCVQDGLSLSNHRGFQKLVSDDFAGDFSCRYLYKRPPVHSKVYVWLKDCSPVECFTGSANYSQMAFGKFQREVLTTCDPAKGYEYFNALNSDTIFCDNLDAESLITVYSDAQYYQRFTKIPDNERDDGAIVKDYENETENVLRCVKVSFLDKRGDLPGGASGLNWAFRPGKPRKNLNEAYIQLPPLVYKSNFFPLRGTHFTVLTDDGKSLICTRAQKDARGHAIETPHNNGLLGEYFRHRLGLAYGAKVTKDDLVRYGRTDVEFCKIDDETFELDFSV